MIHAIAQPSAMGRQDLAVEEEKLLKFKGCMDEPGKCREDSTKQRWSPQVETSRVSIWFV